MKCCLNQHGFKENQIMAVFFSNQNVDILIFFISDRKLFFLFTLRVSVQELCGKCSVLMVGTWQENL